MQRPSFQFYPADWVGNSNLRRCTHAEKGAWIDVICLMHDAVEYGVLRWPLGEVAQAVGCPITVLRGLIAKGVLKGSDEALEPFTYSPRHAGKDGEPVTLIPAQDGPLWYSSRMVRDEYVRRHRGESSRFGTESEAPKGKPKRASMPAPKPPFGDGSSSSSSSSSSFPSHRGAVPSQAGVFVLGDVGGGEISGLGANGCTEHLAGEDASWN